MSNVEYWNGTEAIFLDTVVKFIQKLSYTDQAKVAANIMMMREGDFTSIRTKQLDGPICELIIRQYRFVFFRKGAIIYFVGAFKKKSAKTPIQEIRHARDIFKNI